MKNTRLHRILFYVTGQITAHTAAETPFCAAALSSELFVPCSDRRRRSPDKCPCFRPPAYGAAGSWDACRDRAVRLARHYISFYITWVRRSYWAANIIPKVSCSKSWKWVTGTFIGSMSVSATIRGNGTPCC